MKRKLLLILCSIITLTSCKKSQETTTVELNFIQEFPQEVIVTQFTKNFVHQVDTIKIENKEDRELSLNIDRPKYVFIRVDRPVIKIYTEPGAKLSISRMDDKYQFGGDLMLENEFLQEVQINKELKNKVWDYSSSFDEFKTQMNDYFTFKNELNEQYLSTNKSNYFDELNRIDNKALKNLTILSYILRGSTTAETDSLFFEYFDRSLLNFNTMSSYLDADFLRAFYSKIGVEYYMRRKYGPQLNKLRKNREYYVFRADIISENFPQPIKSILLYNDFKYYPLEYENVIDSSKLTPPRELLNHYKNDLENEVYLYLSEQFNS